MSIYYVYTYIDPRTNIPFYIGKGKDDRYKKHLQHALRELSKYNSSRFLNKIKQILKCNLSPTIKIIQDKLPEHQVFELESFLIEELGRKDINGGILYNKTNGGEGSSGLKHTEKTKHVISLKHKGENNFMYGKQHTEITKIKISNINKGRKPWLTGSSIHSELSQYVWKNAQLIYDCWITNNKCGYIKIQKYLPPIYTTNSLCGIIKKFKNNWVPNQDVDWVGWAK